MTRSTEGRFGAIFGLRGPERPCKPRMERPAPSDLERPHASRTALLVGLAIVLIDVFVIAGAWRSMSLNLRERHEAAARTGQNLARVLAENLEGTLRLVDLALREARAELERRERPGAANGES